MTIETLGAERLGFVGFWERPRAERDQVFAELRAADGPQWFMMPKVPFTESGDGAWALVTHAQVSEASRDAALFSSEPTANSLADLPAILEPYFGSMINMDDPRHAQIRKIVARAFTPKILQQMEEDLRVRATRIVDDLLREGPTDFVTQVAARLPIEVICDMLGIPGEHFADIQRWTNQSLGYTDAEYNGGIPRVDEDLTRVDMLRSFARFVRAGRGLFKLAKRIGEERRRNPTGDLTTKLVVAQDGEEALTPQEFGAFFLLLVAAGNETTRNALAHGVHLFTRNPDQLALLMEDFDGRVGGAIEEIIRFASPVIMFRRNVTRDVVFHGRQMRKGDKVVLFYPSANRDETVFAEPDRFDILRESNRHVGFGGPGPHYCLGAHLARRELTVMLRELYTRVPHLRTVGEPDELRSYFINGIKHMGFAIDAPAADASGAAAVPAVAG